MAKNIDTLKYSILGLLIRDKMYGYDIKTIFDTSLSYLWNASESQIYTTLRRLESDGLVSSTLVVQDQRPNRRVYELTPTGRSEFEDWVKDDVPERFSKDEFLTKLFFCGDADMEVALHHLEGHLENLQRQLAYVNDQYKKYANYSGRHQRRVYFRLIALRYKQVTLEAAEVLVREEIQRIMNPK